MTKAQDRTRAMIQEATWKQRLAEGTSRFNQERKALAESYQLDQAERQTRLKQAQDSGDDALAFSVSTEMLLKAGEFQQEEQRLRSEVFSADSGNPLLEQWYTAETEAWTKSYGNTNETLMQVVESQQQWATDVMEDESYDLAKQQEFVVAMGHLGLEARATSVQEADQRTRIFSISNSMANDLVSKLAIDNRPMSLKAEERQAIVRFFYQQISGGDDWDIDELSAVLTNIDARYQAMKPPAEGKPDPDAPPERTLLQQATNAAARAQSWLAEKMPLTTHVAKQAVKAAPTLAGPIGGLLGGAYEEPMEALREFGGATRRFFTGEAEPSIGDVGAAIGQAFDEVVSGLDERRQAKIGRRGAAIKQAVEAAASEYQKTLGRPAAPNVIRAMLIDAIEGQGAE